MSSSENQPSFDRRRFRDRRLPKDLVRPLAQMKMRVQAGAYVDVTLPSAAELERITRLATGRFALIVSVPEGGGAILPETVWAEVQDQFQTAQVEKGLRVLSLEIRADWYSVGLLAIIGRVLNEAQVSAGVVASASAVHLIMKGTRLKDTRVILDLLVNQAKGRLQAEKSEL